MIELVASDGYGALTVRRLAKRARISSGTFYRHYRSTDDCLLSTFDSACQQVSQRMVEVGQSEPEPRQRLDLAVNRLFQDMVAAPRLATFMLRGAPAVGPAFVNGLRDSTMRLGVALESCMRRGNSPPLHPLLLEGMVAGLSRMGRLLGPTTGEDEIRGLAAEAVEWIMSLNVSSAQDAGLMAAISSQGASGQAAPVPLGNASWEGSLGDERAMILAAAFQGARDGYHQLTVPRICRKAGVSRRDFNRHFESLEDCFVSALEERASNAIAASVRRKPAATTWSYAVHEALRALSDWIEADRQGARVLFVEITATRTKGIASRDRLISQAAQALRTTAPEGGGPSGLAAEASIAAAWAILSRAVQDQGSTTPVAFDVLALLMLGPTIEGAAAMRERGTEIVDLER